MRTKNRLVSLVAFALTLAAQAAPNATIQARMRSGTVALPFGTKPSTLAGFSANGTVHPDGWAVAYNLAITATADNNDGTYRFTVGTLTATGPNGVVTGAPTIELDNQSFGYAQGQTFTIHYWQTAIVRRLRIPLSNGPSFVDLNGPITAPGYPDWDIPGLRIQAMIGAYGYTAATAADVSYYGTPGAGTGQVFFQVVEYQAACTGLTVGTKYYVEFTGVKRKQGTATWYTADPVRVWWVALTPTDSSPWTPADFLPISGPPWEFQYTACTIGTYP